MEKLTEKEIISLLNSLIHSGDLRLKVNIKEDMLETIATSTLTYKNRKLVSSKYSKSKEV
jgi:hypothetical protein